jgi:hypothetical protein
MMNVKLRRWMPRNSVMSDSLSNSREANMRAMRDWPSVALGMVAVSSVLLAFVFYNHRIMEGSLSLSGVSNALRAIL